jgi:hypothetical protein
VPDIQAIDIQANDVQARRPESPNNPFRPVAAVGNLVIFKCKVLSDGIVTLDVSD